MALILRRALLLTGLAFASCTSASESDKGSPAREPGSLPPVDIELIRQLSKTHQTYVDALLLCGSGRPSDWDTARRQLEVIHGYRVFDEDPALIARFRTGDDEARKELARRGLILNALMAFPKGYDKTKWEEARKILVDAGQPGQILLSTTLIEILMNGQFREQWDHVRETLVETGPVALETVTGWARELEARAPADAPIYRIDDLTQACVSLLWFGEKGMPAVEEMARSPKPNVRRAYARGVAEAVHVPSAPTVVRLMAEDPNWTVRTAAAESLGHLTGGKAVAGPALIDRMTKERDRMVLKAVVESVGQLKVAEAIPTLMLLLEVPSAETANLSMGALYHITGQRLTRKEQWVRWYSLEYPAWKARRPRE